MSNKYLDNNLLIDMSNDAAIVALLPELQQVREAATSGKTVGTCTPCAQRAHADAFNVLKATVAHLPDESKRKILELLGVKTLRVLYVEGGRQYEHLIQRREDV